MAETERTTCRRSVTKLVSRAEDLLKDRIDGVDTGGIGKLKHFQSELSGKLTELRDADKIILDDLTEKDAGEDDIDKELDEESEYKEKASSALYLIEDALDKLTASRPLSTGQRTESQEGRNSQICQVAVGSGKSSVKSSG
eukprot:Seg1894.3 transcript_id=Seg1894.3/GoldUCD/mRNA.D3Y31 product="hypothetical protein" protein_id=Seg1894.3/GoldUCD/D3Y31